MSTNQAVCGGCDTAYPASSMKAGATFMCGACGAVVEVRAPEGELELEMLAEGAPERAVVPPRVPPAVAPKPRVAPARVPPRANAVEEAAAIPERIAPAVGPAQRLHGEPRVRRNPWVILGALGGLLLAGLVVAWIATRPSQEEKEASYVAGYVAAGRNALRRSFNEEANDETAAFAAYEASVGGAAVRDRFSQGYDDAIRGISPVYGREEITARRFDPELLIGLVAEHHDPETAEGAFAAAARLETEAGRWSRREAPKEAVDRLRARARELSDAVLRLDPNHARARELRGHARYDDALMRFVEAQWLDQDDREEAKALHTRLARMAANDHGWLAGEELAPLEALEKRLAAIERARKVEADSPFGRAAAKITADTLQQLDELWTKSRDFSRIENAPAREAMKQLVERLGGKRKWTFSVVTRKPFVLFIQDDSSTEADALAEETAKRLRALHVAFLAEYGATFGLKPIEVPVPVLHLHDHDAYQVYSIGNSGGPTAAEAHYEPEKGRLVLHGSTDFTTTLHEATHQIVDHYTRNKPEFLGQSFWFQEGIAEWFGGADRTVDRETGDFVYETGVLQKKRLGGGFGSQLREGRQFGLKQLVDMTYQARNEALMSGRMDKVLLVYTQGWALIYFLNHFDVDDGGLVRCPRPGAAAPGRYAKGWERYLRFELEGRDGKPFTGRKAFMEAFGLDDAGLERMGKEFDAYQAFLVRKLDLGQYRGKYLVPWNEYVNAVGEKTGDRADDLLFP